jgi:hypothetical protein
MSSRHWLALLILASALATTGCGRLLFNFTTDIRSADEISQEISMQAEGFFAEMMRESEQADQPEDEGWTVQTESYTDEADQDVYIVRLSRVASAEELESKQLPVPGATEGQEPEVDFNVTPGPEFTEYRLRILFPPSPKPSALTSVRPEPDAPQLTPEPTPDPALQELEAQITEMLKELFQMSWTVKIPGEIVETNADEVSERGATWNLPFDRLEQGMELLIVSHE